MESGGHTKCMGMATFDVVANATTSVTIRLQCPGKKSCGGTRATPVAS